MSNCTTTLLPVVAVGTLLCSGMMWPSHAADEVNTNPQSLAVQDSEHAGDVSASRPSQVEARERAEMLHELIHGTLIAVHEHYYREDEGIMIPATTLRGVFDRFGERQKIQLRWLAVDAEPMNIEHRPKDDFENAAVKAMKSGQKAYEEISAEQYRYAGTIRLTSECLKCHVPNRTSTRDRQAGIVITIPRHADATP